MNNVPSDAEVGLPSGQQFEIHQGPWRAVITEVGAGLRSLTFDRQELLDTYEAHEMASEGRGQALLPWPGRLEGGQYEFMGAHYQTPINEPATQSAIHGLTRWVNWAPVICETNHLTMALTLHPQPGYPFVLRLEERYALTTAGLTVETTARNIGATPLPYGAGHHPYFAVHAVNSDTVNSAILRVPARSYLRTNERSIPAFPAAAVAGTRFDFRAPRPIGEIALDLGYTNLIIEDGWARVTLSAAGGHPTITVSLSDALPFVQVYTGDHIADPARRRRGVAVEPYTCAPNAFNNGQGLRVLRPGETFSSLWSVAFAH